MVETPPFKALGGPEVLQGSRSRWPWGADGSLPVRIDIPCTP